MLRDDIPKSELDNLLKVLNEGYKVMIYSGNTDITCHHTGNFRMLDNAEWNGKMAWLAAEDQPWLNEETGLTAGYVTRADKVYFVRVTNAGHIVPRSQPALSLQLISQFLDGSL